MVVSAERALLLITAVGATTISASYDAAKLNAYFAAKPGALAARAAELAGIAASTAAPPGAAGAAVAGEAKFWARDGTASAVAAAAHGAFAGGREAVAEALRATGPPDLVAEVLATLEGPVAAASVGQVYKATLGSRPIALKVRRPRVLETVAADAALARGAAALLQPLARTDLVGSCDEFFSRLFEECDYAEVENADLPRPLRRVLHADPHGGNLRKVRDGGACRLAYLDFGLLATVPEAVRDGLVCAVALLCFSRDVDAVAALFGELMLLPRTCSRTAELAALRAALAATVDDVLVFPGGRARRRSFDRLDAGAFCAARDVRALNIVPSPAARRGPP
ncbi:hypothetical protein JL722_14173 [Aureococcus anophagefferens]|nr:hypothetical protein JL722_14173 [Aureococcus anophagefferens]